MMLAYVLVVLIVSLKFYQTHQASDYEVYITDAASDCPGKKEASLSRYFDSTHLEYDWGKRGNLVLNGYTSINVDIDPSEKILFKASVLKNTQGQWVQTMFSIERRDICPQLLDPTEIWHKVFTQFEVEQITCPPKKDMKIMFTNKTIELEVTAPSMDIEGLYKFIINIVTKQYTLCTIIEARAIKIF